MRVAGWECYNPCMEPYSKTYEIRWSDLDANGHVNYAVYIDAAGDLRYHFFTAHGFPPGRFDELGIGPVYTSLHADFFREVRMGETVTVTYALSGLSPSGARWKVRHEVLKSNGKKAVGIDLEGTLLNLSTRKPALPIPELLQVFDLVPRTATFEVLSEMRWLK
jgi:acyl-CoA thioester hydrolase